MTEELLDELDVAIAVAEHRGRGRVSERMSGSAIPRCLFHPGVTEDRDTMSDTRPGVSDRVAACR